MSYSSRRKHELPNEIFAVIYPDGRTRTYIKEAAAKGDATRATNIAKKYNADAPEAQVVRSRLNWQPTEYEFDTSKTIQKQAKYEEKLAKWTLGVSQKQLDIIYSKYPTLKNTHE